MAYQTFRFTLPSEVNYSVINTSGRLISRQKSQVSSERGGKFSRSPNYHHYPETETRWDPTEGPHLKFRKVHFLSVT